METEVMKYAVTQGAFCALFVWLLVDTRKDTKKRETGYQETINKNQTIIGQLTEKFSILEDVKGDLKELKNHIFK